MQGVGVATVTDLQLNAMGSLMSLFAVATTCVSQIWTNTLQKRFSVSSTQLLYNSAPYQVRRHPRESDLDQHAAEAPLRQQRAAALQLRAPETIGGRVEFVGGKMAL